MALEHLHSVNVIYRDLKMENILLTNSGHIIITDLGMSKKAAPGERSYSIVGTPEFMVGGAGTLTPSPRRSSAARATRWRRTSGRWASSPTSSWSAWSPSAATP